MRARRLRCGAERYDVRYRDPATGRQRRRTFADPSAVEAFRAALRSARLVDVRWPLEPLLAPSRLDRRAFARRWGINHETIDRAAIEGLTDLQADRWATRAGYHPVRIWGWAWIDAGLAAGDICELDTEAVA